MEKHVAAQLTDAVLDEAAGRFGITRHDLTPLGDFENYVYAYSKGGQEAVLRLTHSSHRSGEQIEAELDWVEYLAGGGARVARPRRSDAGRLVEPVEVADGAFYASAFDKAPGVPVRQDMNALWNEDLFREWGRTVGQMHALTRDYEPSSGRLRRHAWHEDDDVLNAGEYLPPSETVTIHRCEQLVAEAKALATDRTSYGLIHTDVHPGNFFVHNGRMTVFDFDDASYNFFASDIAIALYYALWFVGSESREDFTQRFMRAFITGYEEENAFLPEWLETIPLFLALRDVVLYVVLHKKWDMASLNEGQRTWLANLKERIDNGVPYVDFDFRQLC